MTSVASVPFIVVMLRCWGESGFKSVSEARPSGRATFASGSPNQTGHSSSMPSLTVGLLTLVFDPKRRVRSTGIEINLFEMIDRRESRPGGQFVLECFNTLQWPLCQSFDAAVVQILHVSHDLMARRHALRK